MKIPILVKAVIEVDDTNEKLCQCQVCGCQVRCSFLTQSYCSWACALFDKVKLNGLKRCKACLNADMDPNLDKCPKCGKGEVMLATDMDSDTLYCYKGVDGKGGEKKGCGWKWTKKRKA